MATCGLSSHGVVLAGAGGDAGGRQETISADQAESMCVLRHADQVRHVSTCGEVSLGPGTVVAVPSVLVYGVEGNAARLYGSC